MPAPAPPPPPDAPALTHLGHALRQRREAMPRTREQLSELLGYGVTVIRDVERGRYHARLTHYLARWDQTIGLDPELRTLWHDVHADQEHHRQPTSLQTISDASLDAVADAPIGLDGEMRRDAFLRLASIPLWAQLHQALNLPEDDFTPLVDHLEAAATRNQELYWSHSASELLGPVLKQLEIALPLFEHPHPQPVLQRLRRAAGELSRQAGWFSFDLHDHVAARQYYASAIEAAEKAKNAELFAHTIGSMTYLYLLDQPHRAHAILQRSRSASNNASAPMRAWLAAIDAEAWSILGDKDACLRALESSESLLNSTPIPPHAVFDMTRYKSFRGSCLLHLGKPTEAEGLLAESLAGDDASSSRHQANVLIHLAQASTQQGHLEATCDRLGQAISIVSQTRQSIGLHRIRKVRAHLEPYRTASAVRHLDEMLRGV